MPRMTIYHSSLNSCTSTSTLLKSDWVSFRKIVHRYKNNKLELKRRIYWVEIFSQTSCVVRCIAGIRGTLTIADGGGGNLGLHPKVTALSGCHADFNIFGLFQHLCAHFINAYFSPSLQPEHFSSNFDEVYN